MKRMLVDPFRALQLWNCGETYAQIADRFVGVNKRNVRESIKFAVSAGLGSLARPLPTVSAPAPKAPKPPRPPAAPIPANLPRAASFNPVVEKILAEAQPGSLREMTRQCDQWIVEMFEDFFAAGNTEWNGKTFRPWIGPVYVRRSLRRAGREDLWEKAQAALRLWRKQHPEPYSYSLPAAIVLRLYGLTCSQIGKLLGVKAGSVALGLRASGLLFSSPSLRRSGPQPFSLAAAVVARLGGMEWAQIGAQLGVRESRIRRALARAGLEVACAA